MKRFFVFFAISLSACQTSKPQTIEWGSIDAQKAAPGTIVSQLVTKDLGDNFYKVSKSVANPPSHWEAVRHIGYVYHGKTEICQCRPGDVAISPKGKYITYYSSPNKRWEIYNTRSQKISEIPDVPIGFPKSAEWNRKEKTLFLSLSRYRDGEIDKVHQITLE